jgi:putative salt-induced outer membrane protein
MLYAEEQLDTDIDAPSPQTSEVSPFSSEVEFGYQSHSGNSDSQSLNARLGSEYVTGRYRFNGEWKYYQLYKDGEEDKRQSSYDLQADYKLTQRTYFYTSFTGYDSRYSAYFKDYTLSSGIGYQFTNTDKLAIEVEAGPGFRSQDPNLDEIDDDDLIFPETVSEAIFRGNASMRWQIVSSLSLTGNVTMVGGESNTRVDSEIGITNTITDDIALKLVHSQAKHSRVPQGLSDKDSVFSANLLFVF